MKIGGSLFLVVIMALVMIPGVWAISTGGGTSISGSGSSQGTFATNGVQTTGYAVASGVLSDTENHWVEDTTGKHAEVGMSVNSAAKLSYSYSLSPNKDKTKVPSQSSLNAQERLDVTNAKQIRANANARNGEGDQANVNVNILIGSITGYTNSATATMAQATASQSATSASGNQIIFNSWANNKELDTACPSLQVTTGSVTGYKNSVTATKTQVSASQTATSGAANSINIYDSAKDSSGTYSISTPINGISGGKATFTGLSETSSAGTTTQVEQKEHVHGTFSSTATGTRTTPAVTKTITRTSNYGTEYDLNMVAKKTTSGPEVSGILGYYVNPTLKIQGAVNAAQSGDIINVAAGKYLENVNINKGLILKGTGSPTASSFTLNAKLGTGSGGITAPIVNVNPVAKIQDGVTLASSGGTVNVAAGKYIENVNINNGLTLKGSGNPTVSSFSLNAKLGTGSGGITAPLITVNAGSKIQDGITLASTNSKVNVNAGTYEDNLDQSFYAKGVTLTGINNPVTKSISLNQNVAGKISGITGNTVNGWSPHYALFLLGTANIIIISPIVQI